MPAQALFTDLYELTMLRAYAEHGMTERAVFSLFVRKLPRGRNYLLACGLETIVDALETLRFSDDDIAYLASLERFPETFLRQLSAFRFTGDIHAMPEGTPVFPNEPILEIIAPIGEAQVVETIVLNQIGLQTILASKAARIVHAAQGRAVVDFGGRRAQGIDAAVKGARAFFIAGVSATSNLHAGRLYDLPVAGTVAHSFIEACVSESDAFKAFAATYPDTTLLVDTYDTLEGVRKVAALAGELGPACRLRGVRLDSGDLAALAKEARAILDAAGLGRLQILASGGLDEYEIDRLVRAGAPIDAFGIGTEMSVSGDAPALDIAYKLTEYAGLGRMKLSPGKRTLPGRKQVFRTFRDGVATGDVIGNHEESLPGVPLLQPVLRHGRRLGQTPPLRHIRAYAADAIASLPRPMVSLQPLETAYEVLVSPRLTAEEKSVRARIAGEAASSGNAASPPTKGVDADQCRTARGGYSWS
jgi:nicotinate phosphoribosyltransferase